MSRTQQEIETELTSLTADFGEAYNEAKSWTDSKELGKKKFFELATEALSLRRLPRKTIDVPAIENAHEYVTKHHPGWRVAGLLMPDHSGPHRITIERDPSVMKYTFVNQEDGRVYARTYEED